MDKSAYRDHFAAFAAKTERSTASRFRDAFEGIELALKAGVTRAQARDELARLGLEIKQNTFNVLLMRVRKERAEKKDRPSADGLSSTAILENAPLRNQSLEKPVLQRGELVKRSESIHLPNDWLTAELTPAQSRSLSAEQKQQRRKARDRLFHPTPYDKLDAK
ncbi:hypothetical protein ASG35_11855 [Burkholderia sp. Leaf177]|uniref:hypothetical protein n=1 Tax=Burkholderia sp. Leaf177 TaxID=1736287 RepID=UPI0006FADB59|nr:hypothetical protein [Burkholderia sp. Leaf177]KQR76971.1 hypothetical protein ASG35_11855 [Burkholderia sp. Leaf177]